MIGCFGVLPARPKVVGVPTLEKMLGAVVRVRVASVGAVLAAGAFGKN